MDVAIAYCLAGLSTFSLIVLWFANTHKVLYQKRDAVYKAREMLRLHQKGYTEKKGMPEEHTAKHMLDTSVEIYEHIKTAYNNSLRNPIYWLPGALMGFRHVKEEIF